MAMVTSVMRVSHLLMTTAEAALAPFGLSFARFEILALLSFTRTGALPLGKVGDRLQVHPTSVSSAVGRLERQGFATRRAHPSDGRTVLVEITEEGRRVVKGATAALNDEVFTELPLTGRQVADLYGLLTRFRANVGDF